MRELYPPPSERAVKKELDHLDRHCRRFIGVRPFVLIASADAHGACDVSPKGGPPAFVRVLEPEQLPSAAEILSDHIGIGDLAASAAALADIYTNRI